MTRHYYQGAEAALICYDVTDAESWDKVKFWVKEVLDIAEVLMIALSFSLILYIYMCF